MKVTASEDLEGRLVVCRLRAKMIGDSLLALGHGDFLNVDQDTISQFGDLARELGNELEAIHAAWEKEGQTE